MSSKRPESSGGKPSKSSKPSSSGKQSAKQRQAEAERRTVPAQADIGEIARAVSTSFLILVFGSLLEPLATSLLPPAIGMFWRILYSLVAFAIVGVRCGRSGPYPPLYGAGGALGAYALVVPLLFVQGTFDPLTMLYTIVFALVVGGAAGQIGVRLRSSS